MSVHTQASPGKPSGEGSPAWDVTQNMRGWPPASQPAVAPSAHWLEQLRDGTVVMIRPICRNDAVIEREFLERLSPESRRCRFLGLVGSPTPEVIQQLTDIDYRDEMALIALVQVAGKEREIGASRYCICTNDRSCECSVAVSDEWRKRGVGAALMRHLIELARQHGLRKMYAMDAVRDEKTHALARYLGFKRVPDPEDPVAVTYELEL